MATGMAVQDVDKIGGVSITSKIYSQIRDDIISGELVPGDKLKVDILRESYDAGASPIREALSMLTTEGFVDRIEQRGFRVAAISQSAFDELLKTRCWLEERAIREAIANGDTYWEEQVVIDHHRLKQTARSDEATESNPGWEAMHKRFHMTLISACGSQFLFDFCQQLYDLNIRYRNIAGRKAYPVRDINQEHLAIFEAVVGRDADLAVSLLLAHYESTGSYLHLSLRAET
jgi:DNA-binding GntR family transcriptional regulator